MKRKLKKILSTPKIAIGIAFVVAVILGGTSYVVNKRVFAERFSKINEVLSAGGVNTGKTSSQDLTLAFPIGGRIKSVSVKVGDTVKAGTVLASLDSENAVGAINQAKAAYEVAQKAYEKLVNGASSPDIEIARVALDNAKNTYTNTVAQQQVSVANALSAMHNAGLIALSTTGNGNALPPIISGTYTGTQEGTYTIKTYATGNGVYFSLSGLEDGGGGSPASSIPTPLGTRGLYIQFLSSSLLANTTWTVSVPNTQSPAYVTYYNAYQSALQNQTQTVATAQGAVDAAQAALDQKLAGARSEDLDMAKAQVQSTQGALQIAQGSYNNTIITAPVDGKVTDVSITAGQIATPNVAAIELLSL